MILKKKYDEKTKTQKVWYESTMMVYSEMVEDELENKGNLYVTFKNGATYLYKDVSFEDYLILIGGGTDASQGKTLNKIIKNKYEYERKDDADLNKILLELNSKEDINHDINNTYFISGHRDLSEIEFEYNYIPIIREILDNNSNANFIVGDCDGCDIFAQNYLVETINDIANITVYCVGETPRNINPNIIYIKNGFVDDREKDIAMTNASFKDIALVRNPKIWSGTGENILRRNIFKN